MEKKILFLAAIGSFISLCAAQSVDLDIGNNADYEGYQVIDSAAQTSRLIISGEDYDFPEFNSKFEFKLLRYLNHRAGFTHYLVEASPARADLINLYIKNGDSATEQLLKSVSKVRYMKLYKNLRRLNLKLPDSLRIQVHGIDVERNYMLPLITIARFLPDSSVPARLQVPVEAIKGAAKYMIIQGLEDYQNEDEEGEEENYSYSRSEFSVRQSVNEFLAQYDSLSGDFRTWLSDSFYVFAGAVEGLREYKTFNRLQRTAMEFTWRDEVMYKRTNDLLAKFPEGKFYGQFGLCRSGFAAIDRDCGINLFRGLAYKLRNTPGSLARDLTTIGIFYSQELDHEVKYRDVQHHRYAAELTALFGAMPDNEARFALPFGDSASLLFRDFSLVVLNNHYQIEGEDDGGDDSSDWTDDEEDSEYRKSRVFIGVNRFTPRMDLNSVNGILKQSGLAVLDAVSFTGVDFMVATESAIGGMHFYSMNSANPSFTGWMVGLKGGNCLIYKRLMKLAIISDIHYTEHRYTRFSGSDSATYFSDFAKPDVYRNPSWVAGISMDMWLDLSPLYLYASGGYQYDFSGRNWVLNNSVTGANGKLTASGLMYNLGVGLSIPLRFFE